MYSVMAAAAQAVRGAVSQAGGLCSARTPGVTFWTPEELWKEAMGSLSMCDVLLSLSCCPGTSPGRGRSRRRGVYSRRGWNPKVLFAKEAQQTRIAGPCWGSFPQHWLALLYLGQPWLIPGFLPRSVHSAWTTLLRALELEAWPWLLAFVLCSALQRRNGRILASST